MRGSSAYHLRKLLSTLATRRPTPHAVQVLAGDDDVYYCCEKCKAKTAATVYMRIHRFPRILQLHIKRFKYAGASCIEFGLTFTPRSFMPSLVV